jgi:two-component system sensor histidine kinase VicK
VPYR